MWVVDECVLNFLKKYGCWIEVVDVKELGLLIIKIMVIDYFNYFFFNNVYFVYNWVLVEVCQYLLMMCCYMWKVEY